MRDPIELRLPEGSMASDLHELEAIGAIGAYLFHLRAGLSHRIAHGLPYASDEIRVCVGKHIQYGEARSALRWLDGLPAFAREAAGTMQVRAYLYLNDLESSNTLLKSLDPRLPEVAFLTGWIAQHLTGRTSTAHRCREIVEEDDLRRATEAIDLLRATHRQSVTDFSRPIHHRIPLVAIPGAGLGRETLVEGARVLRQLLAVSAPLQSSASSSPRRIRNLGLLSSVEKDDLHAEGWHVPALELMSLESLFVELLGATDEECIELAGSLRPLPNEEFYRGWLGYRKGDSFEHLIHALRWPQRAEFTALNPRTGQFTSTQRSVLATRGVHYEFTLGSAPNSAATFVISAHGWHFRRSYLWLPQQETVIGLNPQESMEAYVESTSDILHRLAKLPSRPSGRRVLVTGLNQNIGHFYHNEFAGLYRMIQDDLIAEDDIVLEGPYTYYPIEMLGTRNEVVPARSLEELELAADEMALRGDFTLRPTDIYAPTGLAKRITEMARSQPMEQDWLDAGVLDQRRLRIVIALRSIRRNWLDQGVGVPLLVNELRSLASSYGFLGLTVCLEGFTRTGRYDSSVGEENIIENERATANAMIARYPNCFDGVGLVNAIGLSLLQKARLFGNFDLAVTPKGNGQLPTIAWVCNLPSVVHSNSRDFGSTYYEVSLRPDAVLPSVLDFDSVVDGLRDRADVPTIDEVQVADYRLNFERLLIEIERLVARSRDHRASSLQR